MKSAKLAHNTRDHGRHGKRPTRRRTNHLKRARLARWNNKENVQPPTQPARTHNQDMHTPSQTQHMSRATLPPPESRPTVPPAPPPPPTQSRPTVPPAPPPTQSRPTVPPAPPPTQSRPTVPPAPPPTQSRPTVPPAPPPTQSRPTVPPAPPPTQSRPTVPPAPPPTQSRPTTPPPPPPTQSRPTALYQSRPTVPLPIAEIDCVTENRIINLGNLSDAIQAITHHAADCGEQCCVTGESYRAGLASILQVNCNGCSETFSIPSSKRVKTSDGKHWEVNLGAVLGQMMTGGGASRLATTMAAVGVPSMSKQTFTTTERAWSFHVFGDHTNCSPSFCKACSNRQDDVDEPDSEVTAIQPDGDEREIIPESENDTHISISDKMLDVIDEELRTEQHQLRDENEARFCAARITDVLPTGLLTKVLAASDRIVSLAPQLVNNVTSNLAETYMGIRTYFDGGKLFNRVQSGSFEARCYAAGLRFQNGIEWCLPTWEKYVGHPATNSLQCLVKQTQQRRQEDKDRKSTVKYIMQRRRSKYQSSERASVHYGPNAAQPDLPTNELNKICQEYKQRLNLSDLEQSNIEQQTRDQADDESGLWYEQRRSRLTASNFGTVAKRRCTTPRHPLGQPIRELIKD